MLYDSQSIPCWRSQTVVRIEHQAEITNVGIVVVRWVMDGSKLAEFQC